MSNEVKIALFNLKVKAMHCLQHKYSLHNVYREVVIARFAGASDEECTGAINEARRDFEKGGQI